MKKANFIFELSLLCVSGIVLILLLIFQKGFILYFLLWQIIMVVLQFIHGLILTYFYKKDTVVWNALRIFWTIMGVVLLGLLFRKESWLPPQLYTFTLFVLPWFNAIYITMLTYRYSNKKVPAK